MLVMVENRVNLDGLLWCARLCCAVSVDGQERGCDTKGGHWCLS